MPNSSGGQQEVEQQQEEVEVGEFLQQDEERVVKRRITVSRRPGSRKKSEMFRHSLQTESESYFVPVKVSTMKVAILRQVAFTEKVISTSFGELRLLQQNFVFDSNEKKVKAGKSSREG